MTSLCLCASQTLSTVNNAKQCKSRVFVSGTSFRFLGRSPAFSPQGVYFRKHKPLPASLTVVKTDNARRKVGKELRKARGVILEICILPGNKLCQLDRVKSMDRASDIQHRYGQSVRRNKTPPRLI